jgi:hypothetical protein
MVGGRSYPWRSHTPRGSALWSGFARFSPARLLDRFGGFYLAVLDGTLKRRGWREIGIVVADELEAAERRFFDELHDQDSLGFGAPVAGRIAMLDRAQGGSDVIGLFPEPRGSR